MDRGFISIRYAQALLDFAIEQNQENEVYRQTKNLLQIFDKVPYLRRILDNPQIVISEKKKALITACGEKISTSLDKMLDLIFKNNRGEWIQSIVMRYIELYREKENIHYAQLITATPAEEKTKQRLTSFIKEKIGGKVELETITDPLIVGGFILQVEDYRWDASILRQLNRIKHKLKGINKQIL